MNEKYIQSLRDTIQKTHGCISRYVQTVPVKDEREGKVMWEGRVEVFDLAGHPKAAQCFAWGHKDEEGRWQYVTMLKVAPVDSPLKAVVAFNGGGRGS